jgi:DNA polymerase
MMTREELMRELELLPVWQLRAPLPSQTQTPLQLEEDQVQEVIAEAIVELAIEQDLVEIASISELEMIVDITSISQELTYISSDDGDWLFVLSSLVMTDEEQQLFQNMCKALRIKTKPAGVSTNALMLIDSMQSKLLLAFGEVAAQTLLLSAEPIEALRGSAHQLLGVTLIATYDLAYLLKNPADKAKAWNDLCMGLKTLQNLEVANTQSD